MTAAMSKEEELITLYEHLYAELRDIVDEKIIILSELQELVVAMEKIQDRLDQLHEEINYNGEIT